MDKWTILKQSLEAMENGAYSEYDAINIKPNTASKILHLLHKIEMKEYCKDEKCTDCKCK
jgi:hypothetical protein